MQNVLDDSWAHGVLHLIPKNQPDMRWKGYTELDLRPTCESPGSTVGSQAALTTDERRDIIQSYPLWSRKHSLNSTGDTLEKGQRSKTKMVKGLPPPQREADV